MSSNISEPVQSPRNQSGKGGGGGGRVGVILRLASHHHQLLSSAQDLAPNSLERAHLVHRRDSRIRQAGYLGRSAVNCLPPTTPTSKGDHDSTFEHKLVIQCLPVRALAYMQHRTRLTCSTVAELKQKAAKASESASTKMANTRDRYQSTPTKNTEWDYSNRPKPPPPLAQSPSSIAIASKSPPPRPPPISRSSRPDAAVSPPPAPPPRSAAPPLPLRAPQPEPEPESTSEDIKIDWANLSPEDKAVFFSWLDEFFAGYLGRPIEMVQPGPPASVVVPTGPPVSMLYNMRSGCSSHI